MFSDTATEKGNSPAPQKEDGSSSEFLPDELRPEFTLEKQLGSMGIRSAPKKEKSVENLDYLPMVKNEKQKNDADTKLRKECGDAFSRGVENDRKNLSEDSPADTTAARKR